ncbi:proteoglycan 4 isoform X4 [Myotis myotis]|uniref:proteoglycan 4 isoform X4 n=1 Tax=Myotis myotis TaxID=51298 RepID=UPI00174A8388|nr:proteoglycan 4 isoform X4 [Myotis myotis]
MAMEWKMKLPIHLLLLLSVFLIQQVSSQELSCKGRCSESFERGRECDCDSQCKKYGKCCPDYDDFCEVKDNKKENPKKKPAPEPPVVDEAGSGLDEGDSKPTPTPDTPTTQSTKVTTTSKVTTVTTVSPKPSPSPKPETSKDTSSTASKEKTVETKETSKTTKETSASTSEKTTSGKETRSAEKTSKDLEATSVSVKTTTEAETTTTSLTPTTPQTPSPTTTTKEPTTTPKKPEPTTPKKPEPTTPKKPEPTTPKKPEPTTPKKPEPTTPKKPAPTSPETPPTTSEASTPATTMVPPTPPENPDESTEFPVDPTPKAPEGTKSETTTTSKDKTTEKGTHTTTEITTATSTSTTKETAIPKEDKTTESQTSTTKQVTSTTTKDTTSAKVTPKETTPAPEVTPTEDKTTESQTSTTKQVTSTTTKDTTSAKVTPKETTPAPKVTAATKKTTTTEETTSTSEDTVTTSKVTTAKSPKPTKAPQMPTTTKKPNTTPKVTKPKPTPSPPKTTTSTVPTMNPAFSEEDLLQTTTSSDQASNSDMAEEHPKNEDANDAEGEKPYVILRPPVITPLLIPGADFTVRGSDQGIGVNPMLSDETNLCNGRSVDGLTTLANGTLVAFRGHYFWMLNPLSPPSPPRRITEVWGIPSPIDTVFTRCNCDGKTFFFKGSQYWRFTNDVKDPGYPKQIVKGFGGLNGKILAALSIPKYKERPESVYFFKRGGRVQKYTYKQEPNRQCPGRRPALNYPVYGETTQVRRLRFERAIGSQTHTISIQYSRPVRVLYQDKGFLHNEAQTSTLWRGLPHLVTSAISLPNIRKPDGYDYYAFSRDQAYNLNVPSRTARAVTTPSGKTLSNVWYNCP